MHFRSIAELNDAIVGNLHRLTANVDLIVGIPRSGMLAANMLALHANRPLADLDGFLAGRKLSSGRTRRRPADERTVSQCRHVLVIDDSIRSGVTLANARARIEAMPGAHSFRYAAVFATPEAAPKVDVYCDVCPLPRIFEWNMLHHELLKDACLDIDGVLCRDPLPEENDDGPRYRDFLANGEPRFLPGRPVGYLVTCRLEKYRRETEQWLSRHDVAYRELFMMDFPTKARRIASGSHGAFKAGVYRATPAKLFIESSAKQAVEIAAAAAKPVLCLETHRLINPADSSSSSRLLRKLGSRALRKVGITRSRLPGQSLRQFNGR